MQLMLSVFFLRENKIWVCSPWFLSWSFSDWLKNRSSRREVSLTEHCVLCVIFAGMWGRGFSKGLLRCLVSALLPCTWPSQHSSPGWTAQEPRQHTMSTGTHTWTRWGGGGWDGMQTSPGFIVRSPWNHFALNSPSDRFENWCFRGWT